jgi:uncharacterized protein (DUF3820 family)
LFSQGGLTGRFCYHLVVAAPLFEEFLLWIDKRRNFPHFHLAELSSAISEVSRFLLLKTVLP